MTIDMHCHIEFDKPSRGEHKYPHQAFKEMTEEHLRSIDAKFALLQPYSCPDKTLKGYIRWNKQVADYIQGTPHYAFGRVDPIALSANEIEELAKECVGMGLSGIKLHPWDKFHLECLKEFDYVFSIADKLGVPVMVHTWDGFDIFDELAAERLAPVAEIARRHNIPVIAAHVDISQKGFADAMECPNLYVDVSLQKFEPFKKCMEKNAESPWAERVFYGSDFGVCKMKPLVERGMITPQKIIESMAPENAARILEGNAEKFAAHYLRK